jgi:hypothetical protein
MTKLQQALLNAEVMQAHWIDGGYEALSNLLEEQLRRETEILDIFSLVEQTEPEVKIRVTITLHSWIYCAPLEDVSYVTDLNRVLHIEEDDLYVDWRSRIGGNKGDLLISNLVTDHKGVSWNKSEYIDSVGNIRVIYERHN